MKYILIKDQRLYTDNRIQSGSIGKEFKCIGIRKNLQIPSKWINKTERWHWIYTYKYLEDEKRFEVEIDFFNKFISKKLV